MATRPTLTNSASQPIIIPPLTVDEEDHVILERIHNNERAVTKILKKFHTYASLAHTPIVPVVNQPKGAHTLTHDDAREAFLTELATFELLIRKNAMACEAETRQVEEYQRERERLNAEQETLKVQIEELKVALEHAQMLRRRKIEYDVIAEKANTLPTRSELERAIAELENDMHAIQNEHDTQRRLVQSQKAALDAVVVDLNHLRLLGKEPELIPSVPGSPVQTQTPMPTDSVADLLDRPESPLTDINSDGEGKEDGETDDRRLRKDDTMTDGVVVEDDIEMGEVQEAPKDKFRKDREMEEGEATDASSELSDPPDD